MHWAKFAASASGSFAVCPKEKKERKPAEEKQYQRVTESDIHRLLRHLVTMPCVLMLTLSTLPSTAADADDAWLLMLLLLPVNTTNTTLENIHHR